MPQCILLEVTLSQASQPNDQDLVTLSVRVTRATAEDFKRVADSVYRPVAAEMRRLIEERIVEFESDEAKAA